MEEDLLDEVLGEDEGEDAGEVFALQRLRLAPKSEEQPQEESRRVFTHSNSIVPPQTLAVAWRWMLLSDASLEVWGSGVYCAARVGSEVGQNRRVVATSLRRDAVTHTAPRTEGCGLSRKLFGFQPGCRAHVPGARPERVPWKRRAHRMMDCLVCMKPTPCGMCAWPQNLPPHSCLSSVLQQEKGQGGSGQNRQAQKAAASNPNQPERL